MEKELDPNEAAASLAFATHLQDGMQMAEAPQMKGEMSEEQPMEAPEGQEMPPQSVETEEVVEEPMPEEENPEENKAEDGKEEPNEESKKIDDISKNFDEFKGEVKGMIETKLGDLTDTIKNALKGD
jgi:hypothetical protein